MLDARKRPEPDPFDALRAREFARLDEQNLAYLDYAAAGLYGASQARHYAEQLQSGIFGNPHSQHGPSQASERALAHARSAALDFFDADPAMYEVCFTANTSAAIKLVAESYPFSPRLGLALSADNHNSVNGVREYARRGGARVAVLPLTEDLRLFEPLAGLRKIARDGPGLLAFPAQSNFSGVRHPLDLVEAAQALGFDVLLDAAGTGAAAYVNLRDHPADFLAFSFYKLFGLPTGVGALIVKRTALAKLRRPWFAGGTVDYVSVEHGRHRLRDGPESFEDGTPNFLDIASIETGFAFLNQVSQTDLQARLAMLTASFLSRVRTLSHSNGAPLVEVYGPKTVAARGCTVAFNVLDPTGDSLPFDRVEQQAHAQGVAVRGGCFCNPGAAERAFGFARYDVEKSLDDLGDGFTIKAFQRSLGPQSVVGAVRLSLGLPTNANDLDRAISLMNSFAV
ncbi:aminotransferase class V-fold PLP-dependent enzyme [Phenylobacterium sp.]|jgi:selenocysteine lyase/cysteine desulfurase|uniref:aminotransferase class V-fold PLP-dependent enzyme n=1 Tax=Phenylobacterium sp. TaxID=1871053 RepID=UPI002E310F27|nr:aminotransferase class V-fold PLP-dependent enzyme [Phenylobacterium sp.]HEX3363639.1 aminotransferase class V-fold PLP-dependent enzyme [Phenylobacterium sp.]